MLRPSNEWKLTLPSCKLDSVGMEAKLEGGEGSSPRTTPATQANSEIREYLQVSHRQHQLFPRAALVGVCAGSVAVTFRGLLTGADAFRNTLVSWAHMVPVFGWLFPMAFSAAGATLGVALVYRYAPETSGSSIPHLKAVLHRLRDLVWFRVLVSQIARRSIGDRRRLSAGARGTDRSHGRRSRRWPRASFEGND